MLPAVDEPLPLHRQARSAHHVFESVHYTVDIHYHRNATDRHLSLTLTVSTASLTHGASPKHLLVSQFQQQYTRPAIGATVAKCWYHTAA